MYKLLWAGALLASTFAIFTIPAPRDTAALAAQTVAEARMIDEIREMASAPTNLPVLEASVVLTAPRPTLATDDQLVAELDGSSSERLIVSAEALNLRANPSTTANVLGRLSEGETVEVAAREGGWVRIVTSSGGSGWASADYLTAALQ